MPRQPLAAMFQVSSFQVASIRRERGVDDG